LAMSPRTKAGGIGHEMSRTGLHSLRFARLTPHQASIFTIRGRAYGGAFLGYSCFGKMLRFCRDAPTACPSPQRSRRSRPAERSFIQLESCGRPPKHDLSARKVTDVPPRLHQPRWTCSRRGRNE
jgi:hypothetical protein